MAFYNRSQKMVGHNKVNSLSHSIEVEEHEVPNEIDDDYQEDDEDDKEDNYFDKEFAASMPAQFTVNS